MEVVFEDSERAADLVVQIGSPDATLKDLMAAAVIVDGPQPDRVTIDGRVVGTDLEIIGSGLCRGSVLGGSELSSIAPGPGLELCVVGGLNAARVLPISDGDYTLGRDRQCDVVFDDQSVSRRHCVISVISGTAMIKDTGSTGGTWLNNERIQPHASFSLTPTSIVEIGAQQVVVRPRVVDDRSMAVDPVRTASPVGEVSFNRPPRPARPQGPTPIKVPAAPTERTKPPFNTIAVAMPAVAGIAMVLIIPGHNPLFALMALMTPVMGVGNWLGGRREASKSTRVLGRTYQAALKDFTEELGAAVALERQRRLTTQPDLTEIARRVFLPSVRLWERRPSDPDFLQVSVALARQEWAPPLEAKGAVPSEVGDVVRELSPLADVPVLVDLVASGPVGLVGNRDEALAVARSLVCQAATLQGPGDVAILVLVDHDRASDWEWAKWLPHVRDLRDGDTRLLIVGEDACNATVRDVLNRSPATGRPPRDSGAGPMLLTVIDAENLTRLRASPVRELLRGHRVPATGVVMASSADLLPAECTSFVDLRGIPGEATVHRPQEGVILSDVLATGIGSNTALSIARRMARYEDPDLKVPGSSLPREVRIAPLLEFDSFDPSLICERWNQYDRHVQMLARSDRIAKPPLRGAIGVSEAGTLALDLVHDGPHGLIGGTSGSGKTELLRTLVLGLAATTGPNYLNFVFIDYKGGAGFEALANLPHSVGLLTNLSDGGRDPGKGRELTERALQCLQAELDYRMTCFREAAEPVAELHEFWRVSDIPLPRLVVVIDEFAELAGALADGEFMQAIIRIGRLGRAVGIHLVLATQRPTGVVTQDLKANTNYSIALRVRDQSDSLDVIDVPDAAAIPAKNSGGRAYLRVGGNLGPPPTLFQSAFSGFPVSALVSQRVTVAPFVFGPRMQGDATAPPSADCDPSDSATELESLVAAMKEAFAATGAPAPRRPWADPLPTSISLEDISAMQTSGDSLPQVIGFALGDDLALQAHRNVGWDLDRGNLLFYGVVGSGTTTALASIALAIESAHPPGSADVYVLDFGSGELAELDGLPSVGGVITAGDEERRDRLLHLLLNELRDRKESRQRVEESPRIFLLIDNFGGLAAAAETSPELMQATSRIFAEGVGVGIYVVATADRPNAIPYRIADLAPQRWIFRLADKSDYVNFGLKKHVPSSIPPGRAYIGGSDLAVQVGRPAPSLSAVVAARKEITPMKRRAPTQIGMLPSVVNVDSLVATAWLAEDPWRLPVGIANTTLAPVAWLLHTCEHALVAGPPRSGKSSFLMALAKLTSLVAPELVVVALLGRSSSTLRTSPDVAVATEEVEELSARLSRLEDSTRMLLLVDDAHLIQDTTGEMESILTDPRVHAVVAGRADDLRAAFNHWTQLVRKNRIGLLLRLQQASDGELLGLSLPFGRAFDTQPGRGFVAMDGDFDLVQVPLA